MTGKIVDVNCKEEDRAKAEKGADIIRKGGTVVFPTETVYGLGADAGNDGACSKIYKIKSRQQDNPLIVHLADKESVGKYAHIENVRKYKELEKLWPGPLTIVMPKRETVGNVASAGLDTVGIRIPDCNFTRAFIRMSGTGIAAPSANRSGKPSATMAEHIMDELDGVDLIYRAERSRIGIESTVIFPEGDSCKILRPGAYTEEDLLKIFHQVTYSGKDDPVRSPGMKYRHYSPDKTVLRADAQSLLDYLKEHRDVLPIVTTETAKFIEGDKIVLGSLSNPYEISSSLYDSLRKLDASNYSKGIIESLPERGFFISVMNRIKKASVEL